MGMIDEFVNALKPEDEGAPGKTYSATVAKVDDEGIVWVYLAGSDKETPTSSTSAEIKRGDAVNVEWRNNKLYIAGNYSNPSAGTERVGRVEKTAKNAEDTANNAESTAQSAQASAAAAHQIAADTEQHFWFTETGNDTGAHITEVTQDEWNDSNSPNYHSGGNLLARSNGIAVRKGMDELAQFRADKAIIGKTSEAHQEIAPGKTIFYGDDGTFEVISIEKEVSSGRTMAVIRFPINSQYSAHMSRYDASSSESVIEITNGGFSNNSYVSVGKGIELNAYSGFVYISHQGDDNTVISDSGIDILETGRYMVGGIKIGSVIKMGGTTGGSVTLATSYTTYNMPTQLINYGNAFEVGSNGVKCRADGIISVQGSFRFADGFTANDNIVCRVYNVTRQTGSAIGRYRTPLTAPHTQVLTPVDYMRVYEDDIIKIQAYNATGARGKLNLEDSRLICTYVSAP